MSDNTQIQIAETVEAAYALMDYNDEQQVIRHAQGLIDQATAEKLYYTIRVSGRAVEGISKAGYDELKRYLADRGVYLRDLSVDVVKCPADDRYALITARVAQYRGVIQESVAIGQKRQCMYIITQKEGVTNRQNQFWYEAGGAKAIRNAIASLVPARLKEEYLQFLKSKHKGHAQSNWQGHLEAQLPYKRQPQLQEAKKPYTPPQNNSATLRGNVKYDEVALLDLIKQTREKEIWKGEFFPYDCPLLVDGKEYGASTKDYSWKNLVNMCAKSKATAETKENKDLALFCIYEGKQVEVAYIFRMGQVRLEKDARETGKIMNTPQARQMARCAIIYEEYTRLKEKYKTEKEK